MRKINILGAEYSIGIHKMDEDSVLKDNSWMGYCDEDAKLIIVADLDDEKYFYHDSEEAKDFSFKKTLRHEIIHAFLNESGLSSDALNYNAGWAKNEEMVDWLAIQFPKISKVFAELGID